MSKNRNYIGFKDDLFSCALFVIGKIYLSDERDSLCPIVLPLMKSILMDVSKETTYVEVFVNSIIPTVFQELAVDNCIATVMILLQSGFTNFRMSEVKRFSEQLLSREHSLKTIHSMMNDSDFAKDVISIVLPKLVNYEVEKLDARLVCDLLYSFVVDSETSKELFMVVFLLFTAHVNEVEPKYNFYVFSKISKIIEKNKDIFKLSLQMPILSSKIKSIKEVLT